MSQAQHTKGPWLLTRGHQTKLIRGIHASGRNIINFGGIAAPTQPESQANARLIAAAPDLLAYAQCEEARTRGEDIAETVLKRHGFDPRECTSHEFMDRMRRAALSRATGEQQ